MASTQERVLSVASTLAEERGFDALSIADLTHASGVSNGSIYHHFGSKEGVRAALLLDAVKDYQERLLAVLDEHPRDARGGVLDAVASHLRWTEEHARDARLLIEHRDTLAAGPGRDRLHKLNRHFLKRTSAWLQVQADAGRSARVPVDTAHAIVFAPAQEISRLWLTGRLKVSPATYADVLGDAAWAGLNATATHQPKESR